MEFEPAHAAPHGLRSAKGDFAALCVTERGLLLASGRAGGYRPVYVAWPKPRLVAASTRLAPLLVLLGDTPSLDLEYLSASLLSIGAPCAESTPYLSIRRLPMGELWLVNPGTPPQRWSTSRAFTADVIPDDDELADRLLAAIEKSTVRSTRNARRVGVHVSGGLDSSTLLSLLALQASRGKIASAPEAFSYEASAPVWQDDRPHLKSLEAHIDIRAHRVTPEDASAGIDDLMVVDGLPAPATMLCAARRVGAAARAKNVDVIVVGDGGDSVLDGNPRLFGELARKGKLRAAVHGALRTRGSHAYYQGKIERLVRYLVRPNVEPLLPKAGLRALRRAWHRPPAWAGPTLKRYIAESNHPELPEPAIGASPAERYAGLLSWPAYGRWSLMRQQEELVGGYTLRAPLLDDEFLRFVATIPPLSLMRGGYLRGLMREAVRTLVPDGLRLRETKGTYYFFTEQVLAIEGGFDSLLNLSDVRMLADLKLVEPTTFRQFLETFRGRPRDGATHADVWHVLSVEAFLRQYAAVATGTRRHETA